MTVGRALRMAHETIMPPIGSIVARMSRSEVPGAKLLPMTTYGPARPRMLKPEEASAAAVAAVKLFSFRRAGFGAFRACCGLACCVRWNRAPWICCRWMLEAEAVRLAAGWQIVSSPLLATFSFSYLTFPTRLIKLPLAGCGV